MYTHGFFSIPRSLIVDRNWKSLPYTYRHIFQTILSNICWKEEILDDFGVPVHLKPGQIMITEEELVRYCDEPDIDKSLVHRALVKFEKLKFSDRTSNHKKTIITITRKDIMDIIESRNESNSNQTRITNKEDNNIKRDKTITTKPPFFDENGGGSFKPETIYIKNLKGTVTTYDPSQIYNYFLKHSFPTEIVSQAIQEVRMESKNKAISNVFAFAEAICFRLVQPKEVKKEKKSRKILEFEILPKQRISGVKLQIK